MAKLSRRAIVQGAVAAVAGSAVGGAISSVRGDAAGTKIDDAATFVSDWDRCPKRTWLGPDFWANPLQDWEISSGGAACTNAAADRNVHLLTRQLADRAGDLKMSVRVARVDGDLLSKGKGSFGFRIGVQGPLKEYRNSLISNQGLNCGVSTDGAIFIGDARAAKPGAIKLDVKGAVELRLTAQPAGDAYTVSLSVHDAAGRELGKATRENVPGAQLVGNLALVANFAGPPRAGAASRPANRPNQQQPIFGAGAFTFSDWKVSGSKVQRNDDHAFGPILFNQYTLHNNIMKMTVQMPPIGEKDSQTVSLRYSPAKGGVQVTVGQQIEADSRTATFVVQNWPSDTDVPYELIYKLGWTDGKTQEYTHKGTIRRDPVDNWILTVADISCNGHQAFPNPNYVEQCAKLNPDLIAFVGDQFYESSGGYGIVRKPVDAAILDYLRKWYLHGWTWRELTRDRPSVSLPDDHDVYQGNIWGEGGAPRKSTQEAGGYEMDPRWVNVVHRTQASHHPDPYDRAPAKQGIINYYGPLTYGGISFAILSDRMYKSGPEGKVPPTGGRGDHVSDPNFDPKTADVPGLQLLGEKQMQFLREWAADWKGAELKAVISQTIFTAMATTHGANRERLRADYDANGWPQHARNDALREIRKAGAVHIAGDQHLPAVIQYGIEKHRDAGYAFAGPAVNVTYPRWWEPAEPGKNREAGAPENTGDFTDHFGNPLTVLAVANGKPRPSKGVLESLADKASGLGIVRLDKDKRTVTFECWPFGADVSKPGTQFPGWPVTVKVQGKPKE
jgi:hypothetical protein